MVDVDILGSLYLFNLPLFYLQCNKDGKIAAALKPCQMKAHKKQILYLSSLFELF